jgi:hypothetical protein
MKSTQESSSRATNAVRPARRGPAAEGDRVRAVAVGGWFVAEDLNGEPLAVRLPPWMERGS